MLENHKKNITLSLTLSRVWQINFSMISMASRRFKHNMIREIFEEPKVVVDTLTYVTRTFREAKGFNPNKFDMVYITGSGTSYHAGLAGGYSLSSLASIGTNEVDKDVLSANQAGVMPVRIRKGESRIDEPKSPEAKPKYEITKLSEIFKILETIEKS